MRKPELLLPAGNKECFLTALKYGADAIYIGGEEFGLRAKAKNFTTSEMNECIGIAHKQGVKVYVTANILASNNDLLEARTYFTEMKYMDNRPDALIIADPGIFTLVQEIMPDMEIHISTQANNTNYETFKFWSRLGAKRVVVARELSLKEIKEIRNNIPEEMEIEAFVHGAMCISYSGRCLLSHFMTGRSANKGECTHPCRWKYAVVEENRPGEYMPVEENERGTFIFNSKDLCMIENLPAMIDAGIDSFKIEGRMKTALYVATLARTYRVAFDDYLESPEKFEANLDWYREEIRKVTHREYTTGFFLGKTDTNSQIYDANTYVQGAIYCATVEKTAEKITVKDGEVEGNLAFFEQKNKFSVGEELEILKPGKETVKAKVLALYNEEGEAVESCPHSRQKLWMLLSEPACEGEILRK